MEAVRALQTASRSVDTSKSSDGQTRQQGGKGRGKGEKRAEQRARSISFKGFPEDTKVEEIKE
eukprot:3987368-Karenia_brevis.AAC.1